MPYILGGDDDSDDDSGEDIMIFPITDIDDNDNYGADDEGCGGRSAWGEKRSEPVKVPSFLSLRQRRYSQLGFGNGPLLKLDIKKAVPETNDRICQITDCMSPGRKNWLLAFHKIRSLKDPWETFNIADLPKERAIRHRYNALRKQWKVDEITVKMEQEPFNHGAMRSCFRVKKLSSFSRSRDWKHALNYVGKKYMEAVDRDVYFEDVRLQMDAKLWGEEYNRHNPPKKVDIFQMCVIEFPDRPSSPLYHLEHFIEGNYIKYNSNSGFVEESLRLTPQTFSHFTFERSGHQLIVVDIQGVGDLWTDPQIHTSEGSDYGDGNLGPRGMALFFHSHVCNDVCESLQLTKFDLAPSELATQQQYIKTLKRVSTVVRGFEEMVVCASPQDRVDLTSFLARHRSRGSSSCSYSDEAWGDGSPRERTNSSMSEDDYFPTGSPMEISPTRPRRVRFLSESDDSASATMTEVSVIL